MKRYLDQNLNLLFNFCNPVAVAAKEATKVSTVEVDGVTTAMGVAAVVVVVMAVVVGDNNSHSSNSR